MVLKPGDLPASSDVWNTLSAAAALERVEHDTAADTAYAAIATRWPDNWAVHFAMGNRSYSEKQYAQAVDDYRQAVALNARAGEAWNNLALVLHELGQRDDAIKAAQAAVDAADEAERAQYQTTLDEITSAN